VASGRQELGLTDRRRYHRWQSETARAYVYVRGQGVQRCRVRSVSKAGLFIETRSGLREGTAVELAFARADAEQVVKVYRRSACVLRASAEGVAVVFSRPSSGDRAR
jgi:hypothetical protein